MTWLSENQFIATSVTELISHLGAGAAGVIGLGAAFVEHNAQALIGFAGLTFGLLKWWRYREQILHQRLAEYLKESDARLKQGRQYILDALQRPGPGQPFKLPLFANTMLRSVLRERNWDRTAVAMNVENSADWQLTKSLETIQRQLKTAEDDITSLRQQYATAHILRGAIASSMAFRSPGKASDKNAFALTSFRTALQTPGHEKDVAAKELEAHQLRKLAHLPQALQAYEELELLASSIEDLRTRNLVIARAKRYCAEILQALNAQRGEDGRITFFPTYNAHCLLSSALDPTALSLRAKFAPFQGWDLLEEGDINYLEAFVSSRLSFGKVEQKHLRAAETAYEGVLAGNPRRRLWSKRGVSQLCSAAKTGIKRVRDAQKGNYDVGWLIVP